MRFDGPEEWGVFPACSCFVFAVSMLSWLSYYHFLFGWFLKTAQKNSITNMNLRIYVCYTVRL